MSDASDFFDAIGGEFTRDRYGRPLLIPAGAPASARAPYTRASSFADRVMNMEHIHRWEMRGLARAMSAPESQDFRDLAHAETYNTGYDMDDVDENRASGRKLDTIVARALDRIGWSQMADRGTAVHGFCEDRSRLFDVPEHLKSFVEGYWEAIDRYGIRIAGVEMSIACDKVMSAGTFDSLVHHPLFGWCIADIKTGKLNTGFAVQEAIYANGDLYDFDTDERRPLEAITGGEMVNKDVGLIFDVKAEGTKILTVDIERAWRVAKAIRVVDTELKLDIMTELPEPSLLDQIRHTHDRVAMKRLYDATKDQWGDKHKAAAKERLAASEGGTA